MTALPLEKRVLGLDCVRCGARSRLEAGVYTCAACGGNLQVAYDHDAIARSWSRAELASVRERSIWRYLPLFPVEEALPGPPVGWTPVVESRELARAVGVSALLVKDDGRNPSASFKDRASAIALQRARELGFDMVTGASTGNAASSTAVLAAAVKMRSRIFIPAAAPRAKVAQLLAFGAEVLAVEGNYDQAFDLCLAATERFGWYNRNTGFNPFTREGKKSVSLELCEQLDWEVPDLVVVPVGDGNIISGVWKGFCDLHALGFIERRPRLLAVQAEHSDAIVRALEGDGTIAPVSGQTVADSISVELPRDGEAAVAAVRESGGFAVRVPDHQILAAITTVARGAGVFGEPAGVAGYAGLEQAAAEGRLDPAWRVALLMTGNGLKDIASVMEVAGEPSSVAADPAELERLFAGA